MGASLGAYHAANTLFRYPHQVKRCYALSGIYDLRAFMGGLYDDNFYFHNPVDYMANLSDPVGLRAARVVRHPPRHRHPGRGRRATFTYALSDVLSRKSIRHSVDDWGAAGGHDWPYWKAQMREYLGRW